MAVIIILTTVLAGCGDTQPPREYKLQGSHSWDGLQLSGTVFNRSSVAVPCVYVEYEFTNAGGKVVRTIFEKNKGGISANGSWSFTIDVRSLSIVNVRRSDLSAC